MQSFIYIQFIQNNITYFRGCVVTARERAVTRITNIYIVYRLLVESIEY